MLLEILTEIKNYFMRFEFTGEFEMIDNKLYLASDALKECKKGKFVLITSNFTRELAQIEEITDEYILLATKTPLENDLIGFTALLNVPSTIIALDEKITLWNEKHAYNTVASESFGGWSGSFIQGKDGGQITWQEVFKKDLKPWRRMFVDISRVQ